MRGYYLRRRKSTKYPIKFVVSKDSLHSSGIHVDRVTTVAASVRLGSPHRYDYQMRIEHNDRRTRSQNMRGHVCEQECRVVAYRLVVLVVVSLGEIRGAARDT